MNPLRHLYDTTVMVERETSGGKSPSGAPLKGKAVIVHQDIKCLMQPDKSKLQMLNAGQAAIDFKIMICDILDIRAKDVVTITAAPGGMNVGTRYLVTPDSVFSMPGVAHAEFSLQGGI